MMLLLQDYVFFIPPPPHFTGSLSHFSPSVDDCWYGRVLLIFAFHFRRPDTEQLMRCECAFIETLWQYCPGAANRKQWWPSTAEIGTKMLYLPTSANSVVYVVPLAHILGKLPLVPAGDTGTIPLSMAGHRDQSYPLGKCDNDADSTGSGSSLFYINTWAMTWPTDYHEANYFDSSGSSESESKSESESGQDAMAQDQSESKDASGNSVMDWDRDSD
jgi:hypothetical protein